ncbi:MAG: ROK family protein [Gammaproteobacteria bacterium]|nr:ROK family protein [Gammaproteobacteria bacterium]MBI5615392.1 ROK family protein [Gammaproteobacteria bacterium]
MKRIGIDLGGTKTEGILIDARGRELARHRVPTPARDYAAIVDTVAGLVATLDAEAGMACPVGIGMPGAISTLTGGVKNANTTVLIGKPFAGDLAAELARPVIVENDANCFALSEARDGAAAGADPVFGVIIGTGTGGGIVVGGRVLRGANAIGGEWGHNPLPWPAADELAGRPCYCGKSGCLETFLSGAGLVRTYRDIGGTGCDASEVAARAAAAEALAEEALGRYADQLARGLANVVNVIDPAVIVLGGGLSNIGALYRDVPRLLREYAFSDHLVTEIHPARHGDSSGVRGAAWLWNASGEPASLASC